MLNPRIRIAAGKDRTCPVKSRERHEAEGVSFSRRDCRI
jgi:hypothetical protein